MTSVPPSLPDSPTSGWSTALAAGAAMAFGFAVHERNGTLSPAALVWLTAALCLALAAVGAPRLFAGRGRPETVVLALLGVGLAVAIGKLLGRPPVLTGNIRDASQLQFFFLAIGLAAVIAGGNLSSQPWLGRVGVPLLLLVYFALGIWVIATTRPGIDVHMFQQRGIEALLAGENPYAIRFPDHYGGAFRYYGARLSVDGQLTFGFPYPPMSLFLALPGQLLGGDHRYSQLVAIVLSAACMAYARPSPIATAAMAVFLFTPRTFLVLEMGWTDPFVVLGLCATAFCACRAPRALPWVIGAFLATKQYLLWAIPFLAWLLPSGVSRRARLVFLGKVAAVVALATLPLALWDVGAFVHSVITLQGHQPFRADALSFLAAIGEAALPFPATAFALGATILVGGLAWFRVPRTVSGTVLAVAATYAAFFAFNKQAFCNYYYFVIGALCLAVALGSYCFGPVTRKSS